MNEQLQIAKTIREQLYAGGIREVWSWGSHQWRAMPNTNAFRGGLRFKVNGALFQGIVQIGLRWDDTYTIDIGEKAKYTGVYFDMLTDLIDREVETA